MENIDPIKCTIRTTKTMLQEIIQNYSIHYIKDGKKDLLSNSIINQNLNKSPALIIKYIEDEQKNKYFIIGFKNTILIISFTILSFLQKFISMNSALPIYFLNNTKDVFNSKIKMTVKNEQIDIDEQFEIEIFSFNEATNNFSTNFFKDEQILNSILSCITGYLIQESYKKIISHQKELYDQIMEFLDDSFIKTTRIENCKEDDYIELRNLGSGSSSIVMLIYHIERGELFALKKKKWI